jgi:Flp pilus assembly protein TadD
VLNNLAWLNLDLNNLELALKYSAEAVKLAPKHPSVLDTRGMVLFKAGKVVLASKALASAYKLSEGKDLDISMNYAEVLISNKNSEDALSILKRLQISDLKREKRRNLLLSLANKKIS